MNRPLEDTLRQPPTQQVARDVCGINNTNDHQVGEDEDEEEDEPSVQSPGSCGPRTLSGLTST